MAAATNASPTTAAAASSSSSSEDKFKKFEDDGVTFKAKLIGSELVMEPRGDKMCQNSIQRLKAIIKGQKVHKKRIVMKISYSGVKVCDEKTNEILYHHEVPQISFIASDDTDSRTFGYVCDVPNKAHQFICFKTSGPALQVMSEISSLFEAVLEKKKQSKQDGSSLASGKDKEKDSDNSTSPATITKSTSMLNSVAFRDADDDDDQDVGSTAPTAANFNNNNNNSSSKTDYYKNELATNLESTANDLRDLQITSGGKGESPFDLFASDGGSAGAGGDSGIMDLTFNDWLPSPQHQQQQKQQQQVGQSVASHQHQPQLAPPPPPPSTHYQQQQQQTRPFGGGSAAIPIAKTHRPQAMNFNSSSFSGSRFGSHMLSSTTPTPAMINSASPTLADNNNRFPNSAQNRSLIYNHSSVSLNDAALSNRASSSPMSPLGGFPRQESTDKYAVFNDIDALPSIFESISSLDSASKLSNAGQQLHPASQSMDQRQHQTNRRHQFTTSHSIANSVGAATGTSLTNPQFHQSPPPSSGMARQMNPFDDDFFA